MKRSLLGALLLYGLSTAARAQDYPYSREYTEGSQAVRAHRYVDARSIADDLLETERDSFEAEALLGQVHLWGEDDLGLAEEHLGRARRLLEARFPPPLAGNGPVALHQDILRSLRQAAYLRENYARSLELVAEYNALYKPGLVGLTGWPLLKLGRFSEARKAVEADRLALSADDPGQAGLVDALGEIAYEEGDLVAARESFEEAGLLEIDTADLPDPVYLTNLGEAWRDGLEFGKAEEAWSEAVQWPNPGTYAEPHQRLACLYAGQGRFDLAFAQLEESVAWRGGLNPQVATHTSASHLTSVGEVLLAFGDGERAVEVMRRALHGANRQALTSGAAEVPLAKRYFLYAAALELLAQRRFERASWTLGGERWVQWRGAASDTVAACWARSQGAVLLARGAQGLARSLEAYGPGALQCPWLLPVAGEALGRGPVAEVASGRSRSAALGAYRALWAPGDGGGVGIPESEALARAVVAARSGDWALALRLDPCVGRRLGLSLGVEVEGSPALMSLLEASPRFHAGGDVSVVVASDLSAVVTDTRGGVLGRCGPSTDARTLARRVHEALFERTTSWTSARLEGLTRDAGRGRMASQRLESLLAP